MFLHMDEVKLALKKEKSIFQVKCMSKNGINVLALTDYFPHYFHYEKNLFYLLTTINVKL